MDSVQQRQAAKQFVRDWTGRGDEKQDAQNFWRQLLQQVFGVEEPEKAIAFEYKVKNDQTNTTIFIDGYIQSTQVLIEQKGMNIDLLKSYHQSDGSMLTPYQQARRYAGLLPHNMNPRWIVVCNFQEFHIHNMNQPNADPEIVKLEDFDKEFHRLDFLIDNEKENLRKEMELSLKAGELVGKIHDRFLDQYNDPMAKHTQRSLNILCVRLVFCLYAEDAGLFGAPDAFSKYISQYASKDIRRALIDLFKVLDTPLDQRADMYLPDDLAAFPYVNGGLFRDENIVIPKITDTIKETLIQSSSFNWSEISPTIFGAVFESTLNPETRRSGGMHYTSIENIHKVIDPLFLDDLKKELSEIKEIAVPKVRNQKLDTFQEKLAGLVFLDPASGSGNFLTETYLCLRRLENEAISMKLGGQIVFGDAINPIKVSISQFYGIEINDFAVTVARTALWIAESQMLKETEDIVHMNLDFLPLKTNAYIVEGNALRIDWNSVVDKRKLKYIMGNPPFVGLSLRTDEQQKDMALVFKDNDRAGRLDYVAAWYKKAALYTEGTNIDISFVSTNSICQGEQVPILWDEILNKHSMHINFAYRTFVWNSEAKDKAAVHCVIIGFSHRDRKNKMLFDGENIRNVRQINGYLVDAENVFIALRGNAPANMPKLVQGNKPWDGGYLILSPEEKDELLGEFPEAERFVRPYIGSFEFINRKTRYCLWLNGVSPTEYRNIEPIMKRLEKVAETRRKTKTVAVQAQAETPMLFSQIRQPESNYIMVPETSSSSRRYIPMGFMSKEVIASNSTLVATDATLYMFGVMTSNVHMSWMRTVCGRLKSDYRYSPSIYNNFPWPSPTDVQKETIEKTAQGILDARALYPDSSLADLYDPLTMPPELRKAHIANDRAVMQAYGMPIKETDEAACVAWLMRLYQEKVNQLAE